MCGIFGYYTFGTPKELQAILDVLFTGLKRLEYRGYDSAGLCIDTAEAPGRMSTDGSRRASLDGSATTSPFAANGNGTPGAALEAALAAECKVTDGGEPVIIKCPGKIENLEKMTAEYVKDHVSFVLCWTCRTASSRLMCVCEAYGHMCMSCTAPWCLGECLLQLLPCSQHRSTLAAACLAQHHPA